MFINRVLFEVSYIGNPYGLLTFIGLLCGMAIMIGVSFKRGYVKYAVLVTVIMIIYITTRCKSYYNVVVQYKKGNYLEVEAETLKKQALLAYEEFVGARRCKGNTSIYTLAMPTGEPERRYHTSYAMVDVNRDGIPELHIRTAREITIFSYDESGLFFYGGIFSSPWNHCLLQNGAFLYRYDTGITMGDGYWYYELDDEGNEINDVRFFWEDSNENYIYDEGDIYEFEGASCTKGEWFAKTRAYLYTDVDGKEKIRNQAEWLLYCENDPVETGNQVMYKRTAGGYELTLYDKEHRSIYHKNLPEGLWIDAVSEDVLEIGISAETPVEYAFYFHKETAGISDEFFRPVRFGDKYVAYMEDGKLILTDIFREGMLYQEIRRDFSEDTEIMTPVISIEMSDEENIILKYYKGQERKIESEKIVLEFGNTDRGLQCSDTHDTVIYTLPGNAICHYEARINTPYDGYMVTVYEETPERDIVFDSVLLVEKETGNIYMLGEEDWILAETDGDILKDIDLQEEPKDILESEKDLVLADEEIVDKELEESYDFLKRQEGLADFKIIYDGICMFLDRSYYRVSLYEETDMKILRLQTYFINVENGDFYKESDHVTTGTRMELYYLGNLYAVSMPEERVPDCTWLL